MRVAWVAAAVGAMIGACALVRLLVARMVRRYETVDADTVDVPGGRFYVRGRRIHLTIEGDGPPLLLLHGLGASGRSFAKLAPLLRERYSLITPDLPGFGYSERDPHADLSHEATAALLLELLDRLGVGRCAVLGHSMGAALALRIAAAQPGRVPALAVVSGPGQSDRVLPAWTRPLLALTTPFWVEKRPLVRWLIKAASAPGAAIDVASVDDVLASARVRGHLATLLMIMTGTYHAPPPTPESLAMPTLVMTGERDGYLRPKRARKLAARFPRGRCVVVAGAGHLVLEERPQESARHILALLAAASPSVAPAPATTAPMLTPALGGSG